MRSFLYHSSRSYRQLLYILIFFYLLSHFRVLTNIVTGNDSYGSLLDDFVVVSIYVLYCLNLLAKKSIENWKIDLTRMYLIMILISAFVYGMFFGFFLYGPTNSIIYISTYTFRKLFFPLCMIFVFSSLIANLSHYGAKAIVDSLVEFVVKLLRIAVWYSLLESVVRTFFVSLGRAYLENYRFRWINNGLAHGNSMEDYPIQILKEFTGLDVRRAYGINLEIYTSGHLIFLLYIFYVFMSGKFRIFSLFNGFVFLGLLVSGSRTTILPFLAINAVLFFQKYGKDIYGKIIAGLLSLGSLGLIYFLLRPAWENDDGYIVYLSHAIDLIKLNYDLFVFGIGPVGFPLFSGVLAMAGDRGNDLHHGISALFAFEVILESGLFMTFMFILFHVIVFRTKSVYGKCKSKYIKKLKLIILLNVVVGIAHWPVLFDNTIIIFHTFFIALLYRLSKYGVDPIPRQE